MMRLKKKDMKSLFIISVLVQSLIITGCAGPEYTLLYNGNSQDGEHARGLDIKGSRIIITGNNGAVTFMDRSSNFIKVKEMLNGAEDLRDVYLFKDYAYVALNSGNKGIIYYSAKGDTGPVFSAAGIFFGWFGFLG